ncbi:MAG TPA: hypothetical protein VN792_03085, partial [Candidatus Acidoferrales bacterium]|nr:hypothetical protein [Candidatus Acidoferrales bacterium]
CAQCDNTGYKGRIGIYEILWFDETIREAIRSGASLDEIRGHVATMGMKTMQDDAMDRILEGITSVEEVARVVPVQSLGSAECPACSQRISRTFKFCPRCGAPHEGPSANADPLSKASREEVVQS